MDNEYKIEPSLSRTEVLVSWRSWRFGTYREKDPELTTDARDLWPLPSALRQASDQRIQPLLVAQSTAVTHNCTGLVTLAKSSKNPGVSDSGRRSARGCGRFKSSWKREAWRPEANTATHRCLSCRCKPGDSCRARRSSGRRRATPSQRSLHLRENSCLVAPGTSSHTAEKRHNSETITKSKTEKHSAILDNCDSPTFTTFQQLFQNCGCDGNLIMGLIFLFFISISIFYQFFQPDLLSLWSICEFNSIQLHLHSVCYNLNCV